MGASITSESAAAGSHAPGSLMPPPATITGRSLDSMRRTAAASAAGSGAGELWLRYRSGIRVAATGVWADSTSRGRLMCTGPLRGASATRWLSEVFLVTGSLLVDFLDVSDASRQHAGERWCSCSRIRGVLWRVRIPSILARRPCGCRFVRRGQRSARHCCRTAHRTTPSLPSRSAQRRSGSRLHGDRSAAQSTGERSSRTRC